MVSAILPLPSIPVRFARAVELKVPGDFFSSLLLLCYCVLHVLRHFVHWNWCITAMCSTAVPRQSIVFCNSVSADRIEMAALTPLEGYLFSSVLRFRLSFASHSWQIALELLYIMNAI